MSPHRIDLADFLNQQYLCESLTIKEVKILLEYTELVSFNRNELIADIGEVGEALYFVVKGETALLFETAGEEFEMGRMQEGELMGEMSFFDRVPRMARMRALRTDTRLLKLSRPLYQRLRIEHPYIAVNLLEHAIISLDHLFRRLSGDVATFGQYLYGPNARPKK
ncbi:MAG: cyclic nucleotide-binding protein [Gammaproteobacteria bacterium SG8_47]|nr:MAG: cyclic nucleotide-binding protein [Gammaproteobacteria bacterium SG8_47]